MGFLGFHSKESRGLTPIVYRAPVTALPASSVSTYLVQPKAVLRTPPAPPPRVEPLPPSPAPPRPDPAPAPPARVERPAPPPPLAAPPPARIVASSPPPSLVVPSPARSVALMPPPQKISSPAPSRAPVAAAPAALDPVLPRPASLRILPPARVSPQQATWGPRPAPDLTHLRQGVVLQARGEHGPAVEAFTRAIQADPGCVDAYSSRGISREALGDIDGARADYAQSIDLEVKAGIAAHLAVAREIGL